LRPGRFDRLVYVGIPTGDVEKVRILEALTRKFRLSVEDCEISNPEDRKTFLFDVVKVLSDRKLTSLTGADFYALCSDAMLTAISRKIKKLESQKEDPSIDKSESQKIELEKVSIKILVTKDDFVSAAEKLVPSVSQEDLNYYQNFKTN
jgi:peroxin-6